MAEFSWLNDIPDEEWDLTENVGFLMIFDLHWFVERSGVEADEVWRPGFDVWGQTQPRQYQQFNAAGHVMVLRR